MRDDPLRLNLTVTTRDGRLAEDAFHVFKIKRGMRKSLATNLTLNYFRTLHRESVGLPDIVEMTVDIASSTDAPALADWLCKLKDESSKIEIEGAKVRFEENDIAHALNLHLTTNHQQILLNAMPKHH